MLRLRPSFTESPRRAIDSIEPARVDIAVEEPVVSQRDVGRSIGRVFLRASDLNHPLIVDLSSIRALSVTAAEAMVVPWLSKHRGVRAPLAFATYGTLTRDALDAALRQAHQAAYWLPGKESLPELIGDSTEPERRVVNLVNGLGGRATRAQLRRLTQGEGGIHDSDAIVDALIARQILVDEAGELRVPFTGVSLDLGA